MESIQKSPSLSLAVNTKLVSAIQQCSFLHQVSDLINILVNYMTPWAVLILMTKHNLERKSVFKSRQHWLSSKPPPLAILPTHCLDRWYSDRNLNPDHYTGIFRMWIITHRWPEYLSLCYVALLFERWDSVLQKAPLKSCNRWRGKKPPLPSAHNRLHFSPPEPLCPKDRSQKTAAQAAFASVAASSNPC